MRAEQDEVVDLGGLGAVDEQVVFEQFEVFRPEELLRVEVAIRD